MTNKSCEHEFSITEGGVMYCSRCGYVKEAVQQRICNSEAKSCDHDCIEYWFINPKLVNVGEGYISLKTEHPTCPFCAKAEPQLGDKEFWNIGKKAEHEEKPTTDDNADWFIKYYKIDKTHGEHDEMKWTLRKIIAGERMEERLAWKKKVEEEQANLIARNKELSEVVLKNDELEKKIAELEAELKEYQDEREKVFKESCSIEYSKDDRTHCTCVPALRTIIKTLQSKLDEAHKILDEDQSKIIRNEKDGYPECRPDRELTLAERVKALCKYAADWRRWCLNKESKLDEAVKALEWIRKILPDTNEAIDHILKERPNELYHYLCVDIPALIDEALRKIKESK